MFVIFVTPAFIFVSKPSFDGFVFIFAMGPKRIKKNRKSHFAKKAHPV